MADAIDQLTQDFGIYKAAVDDAFTTVDAAISDLQATVDALKTGATDPAKVAALEAQIAQAKDALAVEKAKVQAADPGAPAPAAPAPPAAPPAAPGDPAPAGGTVTGDPGTAPPPPMPSAPLAERAVYTFDGQDPAAIDHNMWPDAGVVTTDTPPRSLYHFSGDTAPGDKNGDGVGGVFHVYTGPTKASV